MHTGVSASSDVDFTKVPLLVQPIFSNFCSTGVALQLLKAIFTMSKLVYERLIALCFAVMLQSGQRTTEPVYT